MIYQGIQEHLPELNGTFSRGSDATYFDADGILQTAGPNVLRLDHDPVTGKALGAMLEGARTNLVYPSDMSSGQLLVNITRVIAAGIAPDGSQTATKIQATASNTQHRFDRNQAITDGTYTYSVYAKADGYNFVWTRMGAIGAAFDLINGVVTDVVNVTASIASVGNGWHRLIISGPLTGTNVVLRTNTTNVGLAAGGAFVGDEISGCLLWGAQFEAGDFASSLILTAGASTQRLADNLTFARAGTPEGTVVISGRAAAGMGGNQVLWQWDDGTDSNRYRLVRAGDRVLHAVVTVGGADVVDLYLGAIADNAAFKIKFSWEGGRFAGRLNDAAAVVDMAYGGALPTVSTIRIGQDWFHTIASTDIYKTTQI